MARVKINKDKCKGCLLCISFCPKHSLRLDKKLNQRGVRPVEFSRAGECLGCAMCAWICPDCCIEIYK